MSFMADLLRGRQIQDAHVDSEVAYIMLDDGTQITVQGVIVVQPKDIQSAIFEGRQAPVKNSSAAPDMIA